MKFIQQWWRWGSSTILSFKLVKNNRFLRCLLMLLYSLSTCVRKIVAEVAVLTFLKEPILSFFHERNCSGLIYVDKTLHF